MAIKSIVVPALKDSDAGVRRQAAWALGAIDNREAVPGLINALKDYEGTMRMVSEIGYREVQLFGPFPFSAPEAHELVGTLRTGAVRFSLGWASTEHDIDRAASALAALTAET